MKRINQPGRTNNQKEKLKFLIFGFYQHQVKKLILFVETQFTWEKEQNMYVNLHTGLNEIIFIFPFFRYFIF